MPPLVRLHRHEEAAPIPAPQHGRGAAGVLTRRLRRRQGREGGRHLLHGGAFYLTFLSDFSSLPLEQGGMKGDGGAFLA